MRKADNLPLSCAVVTKAGKLNFLEHSGPVQPCNGTALRFTFTLECYGHGDDLWVPEMTADVSTS